MSETVRGGARIHRRALIAGVGAAAACVLGPRRVHAQLPLADRILVEKSRRRISLMRGQDALFTFRAALGRGYGPKIYEGDGRTPEGIYEINGFNPNSSFYRSLRISYPNEADRERAAAAGRRPGGMVMIHGLDSSIEAQWQADHWMYNWTKGCVAVTNGEMDLIWESVGLGTPVEIRG